MTVDVLAKKHTAVAFSRQNSGSAILFSYEYGMTQK